MLIHTAILPYFYLLRTIFFLCGVALEVLRELTNCLSNEEIAGKLFISVNTVRFHIQNMLSKTGFENRLELAMNAKALGLVVSDEDRTKNAKR